MNFDLTGLAMLNRHRDHPLIRAEAYMYMLDTSTVGAGFPFKFTAMARTEHKEPLGKIRPRGATFGCAFLLAGRGCAISTGQVAHGCLDN